MKLLTKKQVMGFLKAPEKLIRGLAETAYDALARVEELTARNQVLVGQIASMQSEASRFADAVTDQKKIDDLNDELWRLRDQIETMQRTQTFIVVFLYRDGRVLVFGERGRQQLRVVPVPDLPESMADERKQYLLKKLGPLLADAIADEELKIIARGNTNQVLTLHGFLYLKAYRQVDQLARENAALKLMLNEPAEATP